MKNAFGMVIGGGIAGIIGSAVWALVAYGAGLEIGWIAWLIGGLVGFGVAMAGGKGGNAGLLAAAIAVLAICLGKVVTVEMLLNHKIEQKVSSSDARDFYEKMKKAAPEFRKLDSTDGYAAFMVTHRLTDARSAENVTQEDLSDFKQRTAPDLQQFESQYPSFDVWKAKKSRSMTAAVAARISVWDELNATLGFMDILFFFLGIATAVRVGSGAVTKE